MRYAPLSSRPCTAIALCLALAVAARHSPAHADDRRVSVGSKKFTESVVLAEIVAGVVEDAGGDVELRSELGGTRVLWNALLAGDIDVYPDYTGTLHHEILAGAAGGDDSALAVKLAEKGVAITGALGFNNTYAIGMKETRARKLGIERISDLQRHADLRFGFTSEFMDRADGWPGLRRRYSLPQTSVRGLDHDLAYRGIASDGIDVTDLYSTDAEIQQYSLRTLVDDLAYFPAYDAVILYRTDLAERMPAVVAALESLRAQISERDMARMNAEVKIDRQEEKVVAGRFLTRRMGIERHSEPTPVTWRLYQRTIEHLTLVAISLTLAILVAVPLGVLAARLPGLGRLILGTVGVVQTIPSLALLVFMIPLLGIGTRPALAALFLYSLLPIVRNTHAGLTGIARPLLESADAMGLTSRSRLRVIELPLAAPSILAGIKTSAVINIGTATLGALIGAGGYGQPILTGIRLDNTGLILQGAIPAALMALAAQLLFDWIEKATVPAGLRG